MKEGLVEAGLYDKVYLMCQPLAYHTPDAGKQGFIDLPEFPFGLEPRILTRWDMHRYAREAYELGVRYIGGCCGFEVIIFELFQIFFLIILDYFELF